MLDTATKKRIDDCRDILVGKLPDPKAQIEQITIGLIYKFMNDMDMEAIELGGKAKFFSDYRVPDPEFPNDRKKDKTIEFSKYAWDNLLNSKVTATEMLRLYSEAIAGMDRNPNIPHLFREIFKNAFLPYRDPETLKLFLKTIGEFEYSHSEKLGDAFEYLLSVMGSQGDAGQFRTPRHIIDFIVAIVNPDKNDTILDPACGTAGFLISSFKHIKEKNKYELTPDERKKLIQNFVGYDISPDMVRLSLVNLYLHGFSDPHIYEYDTLSNEERWDENFDVILANPPFMSPKGGIRPHKKFTITSNRSEVLFVDYIAEHLNPKGKAGIIVPEGVIFQRGSAYKDLRKMLVENYLYGVVSLPAGVFNPYSGVKTSVLLLDKEVSKLRNEIIFIKIDNDGFNLGAQRSSVKGSQLEEAIELTHNFILTGETKENSIGYTVKKSVISKNGDYNLGGERYRENPILNNTKTPFVSLEQLEREGKIEFIRGSGISKKDIYEGGAYKCIHYGDLYTKYNIIIDNISSYTNVEGNVLSKKGDVLVPATTTADALGISIARALNEDNVVLGGDINVIRTKNEFINSIYLAYLISNPPLKITLSKYAKGANILHLSNKDLKDLQIPLPAINVQNELVKDIQEYQKIVDAATIILANYKPKVEFNPQWDLVELGEHCRIKGGYAFKSSDYVDSGVQLVRMGNVKQMFFDIENSPSYLPGKYLDEYSDFVISKNDLLVSMTGTVGKQDYGNVCQIDVDRKFLLNQRVGKFEIQTEKLDQQFLYYVAQTDNFRKQLFANSAGGVRQSNISNKGIESILIPLPPPEVQTQIVKQIQNELELIRANGKLIEIFEWKIINRIAKVWVEDK